MQIKNCSFIVQLVIGMLVIDSSGYLILKVIKEDEECRYMFYSYLCVCSILEDYGHLGKLNRNN